MLKDHIPPSPTLRDLNLGTTRPTRGLPHEHHKPTLPTPGCVTTTTTKPLTSTFTASPELFPSSGTSQVRGRECSAELDRACSHLLAAYDRVEPLTGIGLE